MEHYNVNPQRGRGKGKGRSKGRGKGSHNQYHNQNQGITLVVIMEAKPLGLITSIPTCDLQLI
ncbi:hypothetical protein TSUD_391470 [Trifolium subterraneum]|uniref:Uncharacterized protein n=1 Tax=Trifolium subterraneum TaxID=3900 RepID=A0A2Z6P0K6_TRISU|nr:hypothetical protein TSUD_391470 [Trifolium subterraneum]